MRRPILGFGLAFVAVTALLTVSAAAAGEPAHAYIGADKCKMCHNSPAKGAQYTKWSESAHAKAYTVLASDEAKKIATEKGIADPQKDDGCLGCHVAGHGAPAAMLTDKYKVEDGVSCEACHGPGGDYWKMQVMKDKAQAVAAGLVLPTEATCKECHNEKSPTFKGFDFAAAKAKIAHPLTGPAAK
ncbi:MAG TPA: cytochrome c family protein [Candidatus Polarisedimenticolia bacterium]|nr:cytochrome c family protein [Candidatus Polarisedimenticolia bacterium]